MQLRTLAGTTVTTSALGLGCAGLYRLPRRDHREAVLAAAVAADVRHFDTAPMYGLGRAEAELAPLLRSRRDELTVTTKFGIEPSAIGAMIGRVQGPVRSLLARRSGLQQSVGRSGAGPASGAVGRLLYSAAGYDAGTAARSLTRSLRALRSDYIDIFALHDPMGTAVTNAPELIGYLEDQVRAGTIRCWGIAGELPPTGSPGRRLLEGAPLVQQPDDVFEPAESVSPDRATITFGCLSRALPALLAHVTATPGTRARWSERLGVDAADPQAMAGLLLRAAIRRNPSGVVLFSTTRPERVGAAVESVARPEDPAVASALHAIVQEVALLPEHRERPE
ncbi:MAG TPA: aldo/keto reductase [Mycobacteriales bacterium]|nr:aldo/keto reductase [Mycobacteriales bacterium]